MENKRRNLLYVAIGVMILIVILIIAHSLSQRVHYASDDPLHGSYVQGSGATAVSGHPADFLVSVNVDINDETLVKRAEESGVDLAKCWVYSFSEDKIFSAKKEDNCMRVYENGRVIGTFMYTASKFLWVTYDEKYTVDWRGNKMELSKLMQAFVL